VDHPNCTRRNHIRSPALPAMFLYQEKLLSISSHFLIEPENNHFNKKAEENHQFLIIFFSIAFGVFQK
jgi:hypothetical protein